jgi:hypothetical protein
LGWVVFIFSFGYLSVTSELPDFLFGRRGCQAHTVIINMTDETLDNPYRGVDFKVKDSKY